jgi:hypothetical protein
MFPVTAANGFRFRAASNEEISRIYLFASEFAFSPVNYTIKKEIGLISSLYILFKALKKCIHLFIFW